MGIRCLSGLLLALALAGGAQAQVQAGDTPSDLLGKDRTGDEVRISAHRGKVVVVSFWASWCGYCLKELPVLEQIQRAAGKERLEVVAVNFKEDNRDFRAMRRRLKDLQMTFTHDRDGSLSQPYGVSGLPHLVMIDKAGKVAFVHKGYGEKSLDKFVEEINELLAEPAPAS